MAQIWHGRGTVSQIAEGCRLLGMERPCLIATPSRRHIAMVASFLPGPADVLGIAQDHCPAELVTEAAGRIGAADGFVTVGGAAIGLGKALADRTGLPLIAIATTFAGSALTDSYGVTENGSKRVKRSERARPAISIHDADLFDGFQGPVAVASGMNAMAHAVETLARPDAALSHELAASAIGKLDKALLRGAQTPDIDLAVEGALEAARCLTENGPGLHHRMCHHLGGRYGTPHAATHARILPASVALHAAQNPHFVETMEAALGGSGPLQGRLQQALTNAGLGGGLCALDIPPQAIAELVDLAVRAGHPRNSAEACLGKAYTGE